jgi:hypothetical protein
VVLDHGRIKFEGTPGDFLGLADPSSPRPADTAYAAVVDREA